jgi:hypothetical protein
VTLLTARPQRRTASSPHRPRLLVPRHALDRMLDRAGLPAHEREVLAEIVEIFDAVEADDSLEDEAA